MKKFPKVLNKTKKILNITLVIFLVLGVLTSATGASFLIYKNSGSDDAASNTYDNQKKQDDNNKITSPVDDYNYLPNEISLNEDVVVLSSDDSEEFCDSIIGVDTEGSYGGRITYTLDGENNPSVENLSGGDYVYIQGEEGSLLSADRVFEIDSIENSDGNTIVSFSEPYFEDVYKSMEFAFSDLLTEDNYVGATYAEGVTSHFGDVSSELPNVVSNSYSNGTYKALNNNKNPKSYSNTFTSSTKGSKNSNVPNARKFATQYTKEGPDLIVDIDYEFGNSSNNENEDNNVEKSFGIKGKFGIKDLAAHMVSDIPSITNPKELYFGVSGEVFADITPYGKITSSYEMEADKKDTWFATIEGISEKRFPLVAFQFKGTTPIIISNQTFKNADKQVIPALYLVIYADWKGEITLELSGGFEYSNSFNSGLRLIDNGEFCYKFEDYPYFKANGDEDKDGPNWHIDLDLDADTELTILGSSLLVYVGGVNICELSAARLGVEAQCETHIKASSKEGLKILDSEESEFYIRGFLKFVEIKAKLKADGKGILSKLSVDLDFEYALFDVTLFEKGHKPEKFKPKMPVSTMKPPGEFESIITLVSDVSGSMGDRIATNQTKLEASKEAANTIVDITENWSEKYEGNYGMGIVQFESGAEVLAVPHIDYRFLKECIDSMNCGGGTSIYRGLETGVSQLSSAKALSKVIILMTDGQDSNHSDALEQAEKAAEANIKIFTIGFGEDVDEEILKKIAEVTGGEYRYASTDNIVGIMGSFIFAQQSANSSVLIEYEGAVSEGETSSQMSFDVTSSRGDLIATTVWPGSFLDTIVMDPNGRVVDENYPGATIDESKIPSTLTVSNPLRGKWSVKIKGVETSFDKEPFYTVVSFKEIKTMNKRQEISFFENLAAHSVPIGVYISLISLLLLLCINKKKKS